MAQEPSVSPARLNLLRECPRCFWLEMRLGAKRPPAPFPSLPSRFDRIIQEYCQPYRGAEELPPLLKATGLAGRLVKAAVKAWHDPDTGLVVKGRLDECLQVPQDTFAPLDHKTSGYYHEPFKLNPSYQVQLDVYSLLLRESGYAPAGFGVLVYYVPHVQQLEEGLTLQVHAHTLNTSIPAALRLLSQAREVLDLPSPPPAPHTCAYCQWALRTQDI